MLHPLAVAGDAVQRVCSGERAEIAAIEPGAAGEVVHAGEGRLRTRGHQPLRAVAREPLHQP